MGKRLRFAGFLPLIAIAILVASCEQPKQPPAQTTQAPKTEAAPQVPAQQAKVNGHVETIGEGDNAITVLYAEGTPYQIGYTHGKLLADKIRKWYQTVIMAMCIGMGVPVSKLDEAWAKMEPYVSDDIKQEMQGLADGAGIDIKLVQRAHAIPDLSEYHCTFFAAWGKATPNGHLIQIRALDYATEAGIQNSPAILVLKPVAKNPVVIVGWTGFIGCVSGINGQGIAVSEIGDYYGDEKETLEGEPMPFLLRRVLEEASTLDQAREIIVGAKRTSSYLYCVGDAKVPAALAFQTCKDWAYVFDPISLPNRHLDDVVYFSMGADSKWNEKLYEVLKAKYGQITPEVAMYDVMRGLGTGNLHAVCWDVSELKMWVANAGPAKPGTEGEPAYNREFVQFDVAAALGVQPPIVQAKAKQAQPAGAGQ